MNIFLDAAVRTPYNECTHSPLIERRGNVSSTFQTEVTRDWSPEIFGFAEHLSPDLRRSIEEMFVSPIDLYEQIREAGRHDRKGVHLRAIRAMEVVQNGGKVVDVRYFLRPRRAEELCSDACCSQGDAGFQRAFFLVLEDPASRREVRILGSVSSASRLCSKDRVLLFSTSGEGEGGTAFVVEGLKESGKSPRGFRADGHPSLMDFLDSFKKAIHERITPPPKEEK